MRSIKANPRRRVLWRNVLLAVLAVVGGGAATIAALAGMKIIDPAKLAFWKSKPAYPADWVAIPICAKPIPPYTRVTRDYLINSKTGEWVVDHRPANAVPKGVITDMAKIRGRVTARQKAAPFFFVEDDFLPEGTRPGIAGGTPEGKRAITLNAELLEGAHELKEGDHFDLLASVPVDMPGLGRTGGQRGSQIVATPNTALLPKRSLVKPLVQDGVVVTPMRIRAAPMTSRSLTQGSQTRTRSVQEIVVAVAPDEVAPLAEAMDLEYELTCVARSGRPAASPATSAAPTDAAASKADAADVTPGLNPMGDVRFLEVMVGAQRQFVLFNGPDNSPVVAMQSDNSFKANSPDEPRGRPGLDGENSAKQ